MAHRTAAEGACEMPLERTHVDEGFVDVEDKDA
jgi:hypothetical protein